MSISADLVDQLRRGYGNDPWHGPSTLDLIVDLTAAGAAQRQIPDAHSIWEIVLHMAAWQREVARRLRGAPSRLPQEGDWRTIAEPTESGWDAAKTDLAASLEDLVQAIGAFPDQRWHEAVGQERDRAVGTGYSYQAMTSGVAEHNAYHSGQIAVLRKPRAATR